MKYIREYSKYNEGRSIVDSNNLGDILDDLVDLGHICRVKSDWWSDRSCLVEIWVYSMEGFSKEFYVPDFLPTIERLVSYLETEDYIPDDNTSKKIGVIKESLTWGAPVPDQNSDPFAKKRSPYDGGDRKRISISHMSTLDFRWDIELKTWLIDERSVNFNFRERD